MASLLIDPRETGTARRRPLRVVPSRVSAPNRVSPSGLRRSMARPLRFASTGLVAALVQLSLLALLTRLGWSGLAANAVAFALSAQVNFALSSLFTWRDRVGMPRLGRRWVLFHGSILAMALVNMAVFVLTRPLLPAMAAAAAGIAAAALGNFILGDRLVFRPHPAAYYRGAEDRAGNAAA